MKKDISLIVDNVKLNYRTAVLFFCENNVLLHKPSTDDFWNMPGGRVKFGEDSLSAIKREMQEELGYEIKHAKLLCYCENFFNYDNTDYHELLTVYKVEISKDEQLAQKQDFAPLDKENVLFHWFDKNQVKNVKCLPKIIYDLVEKKNNDIFHYIENNM